MNHWQSPSRCILHISPEKEHDEVVFLKSEEWKTEHVRLLQCMLQIIKCFDSSCCNSWRKRYPIFFHSDSFFPMPISTSGNGLKIDPTKGSFRSLFQSFYLASTLKLRWILLISSRKECEKWKSYILTDVQELLILPFDHSSFEVAEACMPKQTTERLPCWRLVLWGEWCWRWCMGNR